MNEMKGAGVYLLFYFIVAFSIYVRIKQYQIFDQKWLKPALNQIGSFLPLFGCFLLHDVRHPETKV